MTINEFPLSHDIAYLNHAAVAPWPWRTVEAVKRFAEENMTRGAANYAAWLMEEKLLRERLRALLHAPSIDDIALLKNTSEALSVVAHGLAWRDGDNVVASGEEFPSNRVVWESLRDQGVALREANSQAAEDPEGALIALIDERTRLLTISSVQYASGRRMDLKRLGEYCRARGILFCVDAIQSLGAVPLNVREIHADFVMADGHKWMLGPEGLAVFYCGEELRERLRLHQYGWHMLEHHQDYDRRDWTVARSARRFECGSPNMLGIHALNASLSLLLETGLETIEKNVLDNSAYLIEHLSGIAEILTPIEPSRHAGIVTFRPHQTEIDTIFQRLRTQGVICAKRGGGIRFSPHFYTPRAHLDRALDAVRVAIRDART